jgi:hypothetical protein
VSDRAKTARNIGIIVLLAVIVWRIPGGDTASRVIANLLSIILLAGLMFFGYRMYMENRETLLDLPERLRIILYSSAGLAAITLIGTQRAWDEGGAWVLAWFVLLAAAAYGIFAVIRSWRAY